MTTHQGELLVECLVRQMKPTPNGWQMKEHAGKFAAWSPATGAWRAVDLATWEAAHAETTKYKTASKQFGFDVGQFVVGNPPYLEVKRASLPSVEAIPLSARTAAGAAPTSAVTSGDGVITSATAVLVLCDQGQAFYEIPYADIQQWLAANPPAADKSASEVNKPAPGVSPTTPVAPAPKGSTR